MKVVHDCVKNGCRTNEVPDEFESGVEEVREQAFWRSWYGRLFRWLLDYDVENKRFR